MSNIYLERKKDGSYAATQNGRTVAIGDTHAEAGSRAHKRNHTIQFWRSECAIPT